MSVKRSSNDLNDDIIAGMAKLKNETEEQHQEKHYQFDQILQLQNRQLMDLEREQKKQQEELKIKQQQQTDNLKKLLNMNIPFKEKQRALNEQRNNLLKRAKYRQAIVDDQPPVEMALKMVLYFQHQHHQDTYNLLLYQHNQLQHAKTRKEQAHLFLLHQQMYLKLFDIQQKVLLQTLVEQQEKAELECSAMRHLSLNDDNEEDENTMVNDRNDRDMDIIPEAELPQEKDFESLKQQPIPDTPNQISFNNLYHKNHTTHCRGRSLSRSDKIRSQSRSYSRGSNSSASTSTSTTMPSSPLFTFTSSLSNNPPVDSITLNGKMDESTSILSNVLNKSENMDSLDDHRRQEKEFMERSNKILQCKNVKDIKLEGPIPKIPRKEMNPKTKRIIDDFFYKAYEKYRHNKFVMRIREDMIKDGFDAKLFHTGFDDDKEGEMDEMMGSNDLGNELLFNEKDMKMNPLISQAILKENQKRNKEKEIPVNEEKLSSSLSSENDSIINSIDNKMDTEIPVKMKNEKEIEKLNKKEKKLSVKHEAIKEKDKEMKKEDEMEIDKARENVELDGSSMDINMESGSTNEVNSKKDKIKSKEKLISSNKKKESNGKEDNEKGDEKGNEKDNSNDTAVVNNKQKSNTKSKNKKSKSKSKLRSKSKTNLKETNSNKTQEKEKEEENKDTAATTSTASTLDNTKEDEKEKGKEKDNESKKENDKDKIKIKKKEYEKELFYNRGRPKENNKKKKDIFDYNNVDISDANTLIIDGEPVKVKEFIVEESDEENDTGIKGKHKRVVRRFYCTKEGCNKSFTTGGHVSRHIRTCHLALRPFHCKYPGCNSKFGRQDNLRQHYKVHYRKDPKIKFNYREVLTMKQIKLLNISPEIMDVNNDELYPSTNKDTEETTAMTTETNTNNNDNINEKDHENHKSDSHKNNNNKNNNKNNNDNDNNNSNSNKNDTDNNNNNIKNNESTASTSKVENEAMSDKEDKDIEIDNDNDNESEETVCTNNESKDNDTQMISTPEDSSENIDNTPKLSQSMNIDTESKSQEDHVKKEFILSPSIKTTPTTKKPLRPLKHDSITIPVATPPYLQNKSQNSNNINLPINFNLFSNSKLENLKDTKMEKMDVEMTDNNNNNNSNKNTTGLFSSSLNNEMIMTTAGNNIDSTMTDASLIKSEYPVNPVSSTISTTTSLKNNGSITITAPASNTSPSTTTLNINLDNLNQETTHLELGADSITITNSQFPTHSNINLHGLDIVDSLSLNNSINILNTSNTQNNGSKKSSSLQDKVTSMDSQPSIHYMPSPFATPKDFENTPTLSHRIFNSPTSETLSSIPPGSSSNSTVSSTNNSINSIISSTMNNSMNSALNSTTININNSLNASSTIGNTINTNTNLNGVPRINTTGLEITNQASNTTLISPYNPNPDTTNSTMNTTNPVANENISTTNVNGQRLTNPNKSLSTSSYVVDKDSLMRAIANSNLTTATSNPINGIGRSNSLPNPRRAYISIPSVPSQTPTQSQAQPLQAQAQAQAQQTLFNPNALYNTINGSIPGVYSQGSINELTVSSTNVSPNTESITISPNTIDYTSTLNTGNGVGIPSNITLNVSTNNVFVNPSTNTNQTLSNAADTGFQNNNPWLLDFQPMTSNYHQHYPNYHMNTIKNSAMESFAYNSNLTNVSSATTNGTISQQQQQQQQQQSFYFMNLNK